MVSSAPIVIVKRAAFGAALLLAACTGSGDADDPVVARAYDEVLRHSDLARIVPGNTSPHDSLALVSTYVTNWAKQRAEVAKAELNLSEQQKDFEEQLRDYYNSLVIYTYENQLVRQKLNTEVSEEEIQQHYLNEPQEFILKRTIVKCRYFCFSDLDPDVQVIVRRLFRSEEEGYSSEVRVLCEQQGVVYFDGSEQWTDLDQLKADLGLELSDQELLAKEKHEMVVGDRTFFVHFVDHELKDGLSPLSLERNRIRELILNKRKTALIEKMQKDLLEQAIQNGHVEIYL